MYNFHRPVAKKMTDSERKEFAQMVIQRPNRVAQRLAELRGSVTLESIQKKSK